MRKSIQRILSFLVAITLFINLLPANAFAAETNTATVTESTSEENLENAHIVGEVIENRSEFSKEFILSNGLHMASVCAEAVHFEENGQWKDIDNRLQAEIVDGKNAYVNTDGLWDISFPQHLTRDSSISIEKDGYTLDFFLSGEIHSVVNTHVESDDSLAATSAANSEESLSEESLLEETVGEATPEETEPEETVVEEATIPETTAAAIMEEEQETNSAEIVVKGSETVATADEAEETEPTTVAAIVDETVAEEPQAEEAA